MRDGRDLATGPPVGMARFARPTDSRIRALDRTANRKVDTQPLTPMDYLRPASRSTRSASSPWFADAPSLAGSTDLAIHERSTGPSPATIVVDRHRADSA